MQKHLAIGRRVKILDQKNRGGAQRTPPASLRVNQSGLVFYNFLCEIEGKWRLSIEKQVIMKI